MNSCACNMYICHHICYYIHLFYVTTNFNGYVVQLSNAEHVIVRDPSVEKASHRADVENCL